MLAGAVWAVALLVLTSAYDPEDRQVQSLLPAEGTFEAFYQPEVEDVPNGAARPPHAHGSFFKSRHPALVDVSNAPAFGYLFGGTRRFNYN